MISPCLRNLLENKGFGCRQRVKTDEDDFLIFEKLSPLLLYPPQRHAVDTARCRKPFRSKIFIKSMVKRSHRLPQIHESLLDG